MTESGSRRPNRRDCRSIVASVRSSPIPLGPPLQPVGFSAVEVIGETFNNLDLLASPTTAVQRLGPVFVFACVFSAIVALCEAGLGKGVLLDHPFASLDQPGLAQSCPRLTAPPAVAC